MNIRFLLFTFLLLVSIGHADDEEEFLTVHGAQRVTPSYEIPLLTNLPKSIMRALAHYDWGTDDEKVPTQLRGFTFDLNRDGRDEYFICNPVYGGSGGAFYYVFSLFDGDWRCILQFQGSLHMFPVSKGWPRLVSIGRGGGGIWSKTYSGFKKGKYHDTFIEHYDRGTITWERAPKAQTEQ